MNGALNGRLEVCRIFTEHCGPGAKYLHSEPRMRGPHKTIAVVFEMVPEGRKFDLDQVVRDDDIEDAVIKIAEIAKNIREHIKPEPVNGAGI